MCTRNAAVLLSLVTLLGACGEFDLPNQNFGTLDDLTKGTPPRVAVTTAAQGLFGPMRAAPSALTMGILGREAYSLDVSNPQNTPQFYTVVNQLTSYWGYYAPANQANLILTALNTVIGMTDQEKEGVRGFAKTVKAYLLFHVIRQTDVGGAALEPLASPTDAPPAIAGKAAVYTKILQLLDEANTHLLAAGGSFPFTMPSGFSNFNTPATFRQFSRGLRAKVNMTNADVGAPASAYNQVLTDLTGSFIDPTRAMSFGAFHTYSTLAGDALNGLYDPTARQRYAHGALATDAQLKAVGGARDDRFTTKVRALAPFSRYGFDVAWAFDRYNTNVTPLPAMKNEELLLLRAEAYINLGGAANNSLAIADINTVRAGSGGLPPISDPYVANAALNQPATLLDELLYEKRYSLMYEDGDRWVDMRRYGRLAQLPHDRPGDLVWPWLRIPDSECVPRPAPKPAGCVGPGVGF